MRGAEERLRTARDAAADARDHWQDVREARINGIAAELAARLRDGQGCLVCGATEHPHPARPSDRQVGRAEEEAAQAAQQDAAAARESAQAQVARIAAARDAAVTEAGGTPEAELAASHAALERACREASAEAAGLPEARQALDRAVAEHSRLYAAAARGREPCRLRHLPPRGAGPGARRAGRATGTRPG